MKIKDIPFPALRELALEEQERQGNERNDNLHLYNDKLKKNFDWSKSILGDVFWDYVNSYKYQKARKIYDWDKIDNEEKQKSKFSSIFNSALRLIEHKDKNYGNAANKPLDIFSGKAKYGSRIDEKLSRVQNSHELRKNDVVDIFCGMALICQEKGWDNFDEFMD